MIYHLAINSHEVLNLFFQFITADQLAGSGVKAAPPEKTENDGVYTAGLN